MKSPFPVCVLLATMAVAGEAQTTKYGVTVTADKTIDFAGLATYVWTRGQPSWDSTVDRQIITAIDRELAALALTKRAVEPSDVLVTYYSLTRTDVDVKAKPDDKGALPQSAVGTLVVAFLDPASRRELLRLRLDTPIDDPAKLREAIDAGVASLFANYPTRRPR